MDAEDLECAVCLGEKIFCNNKLCQVEVRRPIFEKLLGAEHDIFFGHKDEFCGAKSEPQIVEL